MKYGLLLHNYGKATIQAVGYNIGDPIQTCALQKLYKEMNIQEKDIVYINLCEMSSYKGEYVLLPMLGVGLGVGYAVLPLSPKIIPVFISAHFVVDELSEETVFYLRNYAPIGCRDEYSLKTMRKYNIPAYLSGCITTIFDKRDIILDKGAVYCIDIPESLKKYMSSDLLENAKEMTHLWPISKEKMTEEQAVKFLLDSKKCLLEYKNSAKLVISSRLHALVPCMAMGIPVIAVFENISHRFSWLDKYIPLYTEEQFSEIKWNPDPVDYEDTKRKIKEIFKKIISEAADKYMSLYEISDFYENREKARYGNRYYNALKGIFGEKESFDYAIWGCGLIGNNTYSIMKELYPNAKLRVAIDEYKEGTWQGVDIIKSNEISQDATYFIIIATYSGREPALHVMKKLGREENKDYVYIGTING